jgi:hypothetical protein
MKALRSSETLVLTGATQRNIPEDGILHSLRRETLKSYMIVHVQRPQKMNDASRKAMHAGTIDRGLTVLIYSSISIYTEFRLLNIVSILGTAMYIATQFLVYVRF